MYLSTSRKSYFSQTASRTTLNTFNHQLQPITAQSLEGKALPLTQLRANTLGMSEAYLGPVFSEQIGQFRETFMVHLCPEISVNEMNGDYFRLNL